MSGNGNAVTGRAPEDPEARVGTTVAEKYGIVRLLGKGGMGAVYEGRHGTLARRFALKFLLPTVAANADTIRRFENEANAAGGLEHPNLVAVTDFGRDDQGTPYLVMEYLVGEDCAKVLTRMGPLPCARAANIVVQACRGLAVAHKAGIIHRDLKPANLFLTDAGDGSDLIKVLDFGIAKLKTSDASIATGTGEMFGTAHYMSPEQARGAGEVDARTDVWSLGVVLYELLTGRRPFEDGPFLHVVYQILSTQPPGIGTLRRDVPPALIAVVERAMAKESSARFASVQALAEALGPFAVEGRSAGVVQRSQGYAATVATPATGMVAPGSRSFSELRPGDRRPEAPGVRSGNGRKLVVAIVVSVGVAGGGAALMVARRGGRTTEGSANPASVAAAARPIPAPAPPVTAAPPAQMEHDASPQPPAAGGAATLAPPAESSAHHDAAPGASPPLPGRKQRTRTVSEHFEHRPNTVSERAGIEGGAAASKALAGEGLVPARKVAPAAELSPPGRPIDIETKSPYAR